MIRNYTCAAVLAIFSAACAVGTGLGGSNGTPPSNSSTSTNSNTSSSGAPAAVAPTHVVLPDLTGLSEAAARARLAEVGVTGNIYTRDNTGCERNMEIGAGMVCGQSPRAGARQGSRLAVTLELARSTERGGEGSSAWVKMPDVVGMPIAEATAVLEKAGFAKIQVQQRVDADCKPDVVCGQSPEPGSQGQLKAQKMLFVGAP